MKTHTRGVLDTCPICGHRFTNTDGDVDLYRLELTRLPLPRGLRPQTIHFRIHRHCIDDYPSDQEQQLAGLYVNPEGIAIIKEHQS